MGVGGSIFGCWCRELNTARVISLDNNKNKNKQENFKKESRKINRRQGHSHL